MARGVKGTAGIQCSTPGCTNPPAESPTNPGTFRTMCNPCGSARQRDLRDRQRAERGLPPVPRPDAAPQFTAPDLPDELPPIEELRERRAKEWGRRSRAFDARRCIDVQIHTDGPIGLMALGDLHVDDPGCNWPLLERHTELARETPGMYALAVGDLQNAWIGRLARLYGNQSTSAREAWALVEWWVQALADKLVFISAGNHDCVDDETEALTRRGWLRRHEIRHDDEVLGIDPATGETHWQPIQAIITRPSDGTIRRLKMNAVSLACTGKHRVLHRKRRRPGLWTDLQFAEFDSISSFDHLGIPVAGTTPSGGCDLSDAELRVAAWILTDGCIPKDTPRIAIYQRVSKAHLVRESLDAAGVVYRETTRDIKQTEICGRKLLKKPERMTEFRIGAEESRRLTARLDMPSKYPWPAWVWRLSDAQFEVFLSTLIDGDGTRPKSAKKALVFYKPKPQLDTLQALCAMHGYSAHLYCYRETQWRLNIAKRTQVEVPSTNRPTVEEYHGTVWCLTVPLSNFLIRRDGKAHFTGNCWARTVNNIDPVGWIASQQGTIYGNNGARVALCLPNGERIVINCRHDFTGRSQYNPAHGVVKAAMFGRRDDLLFAGHTHQTGYSPVKDPSSGKVSHAIRLASYKVIDDYAMERGFPDANISEAVVCIYDPLTEDPRHRIHVDFDVERGAWMLTKLREEWERRQPPKKKRAA